MSRQQEGDEREPGLRELGGREREPQMPGERGSRERSGRERGSATIWMIGVAAVVFTAAVAVTLAGTARVARHRVQTAADFGALAAARLALADPERGCAEAALLSAENNARLTRCDIGADGVAAVRTVMRFSLPIVGSRDVTAYARAGPVHVPGLPVTAEPPVLPDEAGRLPPGE
ncbi:Rv3654c family TadE-like protein [Planobispora rosea]|uniref:Rv3654c family TadE-like protein n=1 Tax=Planobispora rosea TaxID=35762 RepID=UPI00194568FD|nr:Rv3654c family TadE-like protein [Planobispora rosea]